MRCNPHRLCACSRHRKKPITLTKWAAGLGLAVWCALSVAQGAVQTDAALCDRAALAASEEVGVPLEVLRAITRMETGRKDPHSGVFAPWPWATNEGGSGLWFEGQIGALSHAQSRLAQGVTNIDIGCFQLNFRWHSSAFSSLRDMFDPMENARYAASYLLDQYRRTGDWSTAAGAYHSGTKELALAYRARFDATMAELAQTAGTTESEADEEPAPRHNGFPLLVADGQGRGGSLVPLSSVARPLFGTP